jgi:hypothetical protein
MNKWPKLLLFAFALVFLFSQIIPARAEGEQPITFHVLFVSPTQTITDAEGTIIWTGSFTNPECTGIQCSDQLIHNGTISLHNLCTGTGCASQNIYYKAVFTGTWQSPFSGTPGATIPPSMGWQVGEGNTELLPCDGSGDHGTCTFHQTGTIPADQISTSSDPLTVHESFLFNFSWPFGRITSLYYSITVSTSPIPDGDCSTQWLPGTKFASFQLTATNQQGANLSLLSGWPEPGAWVIVKVASGSWQNNGSSAERTSLSISDGANEWHSLAAYQNISCYKGSTYYMQVGQKFYNYHLRVADLDGNFSANTGTLNIELYYSTYSPFKTGCDANYKVGALVESRTTQANLEDGITIGADARMNDLRPMGGEGQFGDIPKGTPQVQMMMLEVDKGPYFDGLLYSYASQIMDSTGWHDDLEFPYALCVVQLDTMHRVRIYFAYSNNIYQWKFRARDTDGIYANNTGNIGYSLYYVDNLQIYRPGNPAMDCSKYSHTTPGTDIPIQANATAGHVLSLTANNLYAIETTLGPWSNNGANSFDVAISDDGLTWNNLYEYPYILCATTGADTDHVLVYFQAMSGKTYRLRVHDPGGTFTDNSGSIVAKLYDAATTIADWNPCSDNYAFTEQSIPEDARHVAAQYSDGAGIPYIQNGKIYGLEISDKAGWSTAGSSAKRYDAEISDDGGTTWQVYQAADFISCAVIKYSGDETTSRFRIIFTANGNYKLRVNGADPSNTGDLIYTLYTATAVDLGSNIGGTTTPGAYVPPEWRTTCYEVCNRPDKLVTFVALTLPPVTLGSWGTFTIPYFYYPVSDIGGWIDYERCALQKFLSVCPEHIQALLSIRNMFDAREPFGTILEFENAATNVKTQIDSLVSSGGENNQQFGPYSVIWNIGGGETGQSWSGILPSAQGTPWDGTPLDFSGVNDPATGGESYTTTAYYAYCLIGMNGMIGEMAPTFCEGIGFIKTTMNWAFVGLQFILDLGTLYLAIIYFKRNWIDIR